MHAVIIHPEGDAYAVGHPQDEDEQYWNVRKAIDCKLVERVAFQVDGDPLELWVDEEGLLNSLPYNGAAVRLISGGSLDAVIVGRAYVTGPNMSPLTCDQAEKIASIIGGRE